MQSIHSYFSSFSKRIRHPFQITVPFILLFCFLSTISISGLVSFHINKIDALKNENQQLLIDNHSLRTEHQQLTDQIDQLRFDDQRLKNAQLQQEITAIQSTYNTAIKAYEQLLDIKEGKGKSSPLDKSFADVLAILASKDYASGSAQLKTFEKLLTAEQLKIATQSAIAVITAPVSNTPPASGFSRQRVQTDVGEFIVDIIVADLRSAKVIVDTASDSTCTNNCPVLPLASYVSRSGAFAGINGTYFCPESYPSCAGKTNTFDLLVMNKNKSYFNSDNNVYSQNPVAIFSGNGARFLSKAQDWGRDTGVDSVISNFPLLVINGQNQFGGNDDPKMSSKGNRGFLAAKDTFAYMGFVRNASVAQAAKVLQIMGMQHALNLDSGGSSALWFGGYKLGPGRSIPNAVLFVRR